MPKPKTHSAWFSLTAVLLAFGLSGCFGLRQPSSTDTQGGNNNQQQSSGDAYNDLFNWKPSNTGQNSNDDDDDVTPPPPAASPKSLTCTWTIADGSPIVVTGTCPIPSCTTTTSSELTAVFPEGDISGATGLAVYLGSAPINTQFYTADTAVRKFRFSNLFCSYTAQNIVVKFNYAD
ncbi:hypothetical protein K2X33_00575 [bacterium]|nr:hypothetical protein [bacterium]